MDIGKDETLWLLKGGTGSVWELEGDDGRHLEWIVLERAKHASMEDELQS